ncbi:MAG: hypothetical protein EHM85_15110 [Desulfobacteraceae bacterium]|nr:MAG: hypothetical protein EHM85_15110 [Desulfobacteraceae bacterium]
MEAIITDHLEGIKFGEIQTHKHVSVMPMSSNNGSGPVYLTMKEAIENSLLTVTEVSEGGHVPELKVINRADKPVLLIDGEELIGAKQNRVLNTTILLKEKSETVIPVSCTEHGRWSYQSGHFEESAYMMSATLRNIKNVSVLHSLQNTGAFASDQGAVWDGISDQAEAAGVRSKTGAMRDIHETRKEDLDDWLEHFSPVAEQKGLLVMVNGKVVGLDMVSDTGAFSVIYLKLIRSYLMDAILEKPGKGKAASSPEKAKSFISKILTCTEKRYDSVGHGQDYRYDGKKIVGSALIHDNTVIHMAFFGITEAEKAGHMSPLSRRKMNRTR